MGKLNLPAIKNSKIVALDTVILIYFLEQHPVYYQTTRQIFQRIESGQLSAVMASLVFAELLVPAYRSEEEERAVKLIRTLSNFPHLEIIPLTTEIAADAARLRARYNIRTPDAIHAATAITSEAEGLITNDQGLVRLGTELKIWLLD